MHTEVFLHFADHEAHNITNFIACYAVSLPNLSVRNVSQMVLIVSVTP